MHLLGDRARLVHGGLSLLTGAEHHCLALPLGGVDSAGGIPLGPPANHLGIALGLLALVFGALRGAGGLAIATVERRLALR